jgi:hypothetical protein
MEPPPPQRRKRKVPQIKNPGPEGNVGSWDFLPSFQVEVPIPGPVINISGPEIVRSWDLRDLPGPTGGPTGGPMIKHIRF